jgi:AraC family transcriptional regulator
VKQPNERLVALLIEVQRTLDEDIDLGSLAAEFGASAFHFHRTFAAAVGETPKKHVERLRLERAAFLLAVTDEPILDIALAVGFKNPETFSRNFRNFLGLSARGYRQMAKRAQAERVAGTDFHADPDFTLSRARFAKLPAQTLLALRHVGYYGALHERFGTATDPWDELGAWAHERGVPASGARIGIYYDDPTLTPEPLQRADICIAVPEPVEGTERIRSIAFAGGLYAITEYVGRCDTLLSAFRGTADEIRRSPTHTFRDASPLEVVRATNVNGVAGVHRFDVCFAVQKRAPG